MKAVKKELQFEENLKQRLNFICEFAKVTPTKVLSSSRVVPFFIVLKYSSLISFKKIRDTILSKYLIINIVVSI